MDEWNQYEKPIMVHSDGTIMLETRHQEAERLERKLLEVARPIQRNEYLVTYRLCPLACWQAKAKGKKADDLLHWLEQQSKWPVPSHVAHELRETMERFGQVRLLPYDDKYLLVEWKDERVKKLFDFDQGESFFFKQKEGQTLLPHSDRGLFKQACYAKGFPVLDQAGSEEGERLELKWSPDFGGLRDYQAQAVEAFCGKKGIASQSGVIVLPCGAGKTVVGLGVMEKIGRATLILTVSASSAQQWIREMKSKLVLPDQAIGQYTAQTKEIRPITVTTYQMLTHRSPQEDHYPHMRIFSERDWGLIIYDEVHLLPAPIFRATANLQAKRRLGLTATLIREDGREGDVFTLIGPKIYESSWKELESVGWISEARLIEIRVPFREEDWERYLHAPKRQQYRLAAENPCKLEVIGKLLEKHDQEPVLIIGQYLSQLQTIAKKYGLPLITGKMAQEKREEIYQRFRQGEIRVLVVSKVANMAVDLPDACVAIQVSGTYGSRQEEAQRLGRVLRLKAPGQKAHFYQLVTKDSVDQSFAMKRQCFLAEQGYSYEVVEMGGET